MTTIPARSTPEAAASSPDPASLRVALKGDWLLEAAHPHSRDLVPRLDSNPDLRRIGYETAELGDWDTGLVTFLVGLERAARERGAEVDHAGLPEGARRLVDLAFAVAERQGARRQEAREGIVSRLGQACLAAFAEARRSVVFLGELSLSFGRLLRGKAVYERSDLAVTIQEVSFEALGIISVVGFLVGVILGFIGAVQFQQFGAGIYTANLVGLGIVRELGPIMAGIIMAGRTGAAFAAHIGTMKVNEEIDALRTLGIDPIDYLVLPRALALMLMMPLLTLYADLLGILGGTAVSLGLLDVTAGLFLEQLRGALGFSDLAGGLFMAAVFGVLVALAGCQRGIECGTSAQAVGKATTSAVVTGIVAIIAACSVLNWVYVVLGI